jgi:hypothetical protein
MHDLRLPDGVAMQFKTRDRLAGIGPSDIRVDFGESGADDPASTSAAQTPADASRSSR